jgi:arginyl-tRNA--protein-N-Asp/Glu arginylyltransferase
MAYKARFQPSEILTGGHWRLMDPAEIRQPSE